MAELEGEGAGDGEDDGEGIDGGGDVSAALYKVHVGEGAVADGDEKAEARKALYPGCVKHAEILHGGDDGQCTDEREIGSRKHADEDGGDDAPEEECAEASPQEDGGFAWGCFIGFDIHGCRKDARRWVEGWQTFPENLRKLCGFLQRVGEHLGRAEVLPVPGGPAQSDSAPKTPIKL